MSVGRRAKFVMAALGVTALCCGLVVASAGLTDASPLPVSFAAPVAYRTGGTVGVAASYPSVVASDVDSDGLADVVVPNFWDNTVSVLLGYGYGTLGDPMVFATGTAPDGVVLGDFNRDGIVDLAVANAWANTVSVLLGNGGGWFGPHHEFATGGDGPWGMAVGDFNGDALLDVAVANAYGDTVSVLLGNGDGTLGAPNVIANVDGPTPTVVADLNGDGVLDLALGSSSSGTALVLLGNGDGTFVRSDFVVGPGAGWVAVADLNGDSVLDLAVTGASSDTVSVLLGNGDGTFGAHTDFATNDEPAAVLVADLNGDSVPELVVGNTGAEFVSVLLGNGDGTFGAHTDFATTPTHLSGMAVKDLDGDGRVDLVYSEGYRGTVSVLLNTTAPTAPDAPTVLRNATAANQSATISWLAPAFDGGSPIRGYVVTAYVGYAPVKVRIFNSPSTTQTVTGLTNGTEYRFRVRAYNTYGVSGYSKVSNPVTPTA